MWDEPFWKEKYSLGWCDLCSVAIIACPECKNISCNGGGCSECNDTFSGFLQGKICVEQYLSEEEIKVYQKNLQIKRFILETLAKGESQIDWKKLRDEGKMSQRDEEFFTKELEEEHPQAILDFAEKVLLKTYSPEKTTQPPLVVCGEIFEHISGYPKIQIEKTDFVAELSKLSKEALLFIYQGLTELEDIRRRLDEHRNKKKN